MRCVGTGGHLHNIGVALVNTIEDTNTATTPATHTTVPTSTTSFTSPDRQVFIYRQMMDDGMFKACGGVNHYALPNPACFRQTNSLHLAGIFNALQLPYFIIYYNILYYYI